MPESYYTGPPPDFKKERAGYEYRVPISEDIAWKLGYSRIDFDNRSFEYLKKKLEKLKIPTEKIQDLIDELYIIVNNAGKLKIKPYTINFFLEDFEAVWENFCIYGLSNSRWIDELNHVRRYALHVLLQEYYKSIDGWQGDNLLRQKMEEKHAYTMEQREVAAKKKGLFGKKEKKPAPMPIASEGYTFTER